MKTKNLTGPISLSLLVIGFLFQSTIAISQPNIILIIGDDVGYEIPTYNGGESYETPNLDFMAASGTQFPNCFAYPEGPPTRLALWTGKHNCRNEIRPRYISPTDITLGNMLHDAGYKTAYVGKWHLDGGDSSIISHGFDDYLVFMPYNPETTGFDQWYRRYKNPLLYQNGNYLPDSVVEGKYSEDLYYNYISDYIDNHTTTPFFMVYSCNLVQHPWSPTPDDPDFAAWDPSGDEKSKEDIKYFPGMVKYMDKMIGNVITKINDAGLGNNTIILFTSDNTTFPAIKSLYKGSLVTGGKNRTTRNGINIPLVVYGPGTVLPGITDTSLVDITDFFPTFADIAGIEKPATLEPLDGITFYDNLTGNTANEEKQKKYVFCSWLDAIGPEALSQDDTIKYVFNYKYKLYDPAHGGFYDISDPDQQKLLPDSTLTCNEKVIKKQLQNILDSLCYSSINNFNVCNSPNDDCVTTFYRDLDGDGYGDPNNSIIQSCPASSEYVLDNTDCDDNNASIHAGASEICGNGIDDNCNNQIDEGCGTGSGTCSNATGLTVTGITSASATLNWNASVDPTRWQIQYRMATGNTIWTNIRPAGSARSLNLSSLAAKQRYKWRIRAKCGTIWTAYSSIVTFKTLAASKSASQVSASVEDMFSGKTLMLKVYPNPSKGQFAIELSLGTEKNTNAKIELINIMGQTVYTENGNIRSGRFQSTVSLPSSLAQGIYTVKIIAENKVYVAKLIYKK